MIGRDIAIAVAYPGLSTAANNKKITPPPSPEGLEGGNRGEFGQVVMLLFLHVAREEFATALSICASPRTELLSTTATMLF